MRYQSIEQMLYKVFDIKAQPIIGRGNTLSIVKHMTLKGADSFSKVGMNQHDRLAHAVMVLTQVEDVLLPDEWAYVNLNYGYNFSYIIDLTSYICGELPDLDLRLCDDLLANIILKNVKIVEIQDKFDISRYTLMRRIKRLKPIINDLHNRVIIKLESALAQRLLKDSCA